MGEGWRKNQYNIYISAKLAVCQGWQEFQNDWKLWLSTCEWNAYKWKRKLLKLKGRLLLKSCQWYNHIRENAKTKIFLGFLM